MAFRVHHHLLSSVAPPLLTRLFLRPSSSPLLLRPLSCLSSPSSPALPFTSSRSYSPSLLPPSSLLRLLSPSLGLRPHVRCSSSLKAKGQPRGPLWRQRKGVSKEALQVVFELKRCKGDRQKERSVLRTSASRLLKMDLLMVLVELRRQEECSLAKQVFDMVRGEEWYKPDIYLYREMLDTFGKKKLIEDVEQLFREMQEEGITPNVMILTELMGAYIRNDDITQAYEVYEQIRQGDYEPEYVMYDILCRALKRAGDFERLKKVMDVCTEAFPDNPPPFSRALLEQR